MSAEPSTPLLAPWPKPKVEKRGQRIRRRLWVTLLFAALMAGLILPVSAHMWPRRGLGYGLYWVHDNVYLPLQGYLYHRFFPESLMWWGALALLLGIWGLGWLTATSLVRQPHRRLLMRVVRLPNAEAFLLRSAHRFTRLGVRPQLLEVVVDDLRTRALLKAQTQMISKPKSSLSVRVLARFTRFHFRILMEPRFVEEARLGRWQALCEWHDAFLMARLARDVPGQRLLARTLIPHLRLAIPKTLSDQNHTPSDAFIYKNFLADLAVLVGYTHGAPPDEEEGFSPMKEEEAREWLLNALQTRLHALASWRVFLQEQSRHPRPPSFAEAPPELPKLPPPALAPQVGQLSLSLALHIAHATGAHDLGLAFYDAVDALDMTLQLTAAPMSDSPQIVSLTSFLSSIPRPFDHSLYHRFLADRYLDTFQGIEEGFLSSPDESDAALSENDRAWADFLASHYHRRSGPIS